MGKDGLGQGRYENWCMADTKRGCPRDAVRICLVALWVIGLICGCTGEVVEIPVKEAVTLPPSEPAVFYDTEPETETESESESESAHRGVLVGEKKNLLTDTQMEAVFNYMDRYYEALASLEMKELADLFSGSAGGQVAFHENAWEYMIEMRRMQASDLRLDDYFYRLWILEAEVQADGSVNVDIAEQSLLRFQMMPEVTSIYPGYWHDFVLVKEDGKWLLSEHMQWEGAFWNMLKGYQGQDLEEMDDPARVFADRREKLLGQVEDDLEKRGRQHAAAGKSESFQQVPGHEYDREAAVAYARAHVDERSDEWHDYSGEGGNCQNFVSQCLLAGGIPMDIEGSAKWKWYGEALDNTSGRTGCTLSWINVDYFYAYARDNSGYGLTAQVDADYTSGQTGDLIMMGTPEDWNHMVVISEVVKNAEGETIDYMICSNTTDVQDFPASAYPSPRRSLIRILGWN